MYTITVSEKGGQQSQFEFDKPEITIGRMKGNDIVLPKGNVSKRHSRIFAQDSSFKIIDLDSTNGTYVNGRKITGEQPITDADKIYIGDFILQVEPEAGAQPPPPAPPGPGLPSPGPGPGAPGPGPGPAAPSAPHNPGPPPAPSAPGLGASGGPDLGGFSGSAAGSTAQGFAGSNGGPPPSAPAITDSQAAFGVTPDPPAPSPTPAPTPAQSPPGPPAPSPTGSFGSTGSAGSRLPSPGPAPRARDNSGGGGGERIGARPQYSQVRAIVASAELESEFDEADHNARVQTAEALFESITPQDLPFNYPPSQEDNDRMRSAVEAAYGQANPGGNRDAVIDAVTRECVGLGPVDRYLDDPEVRDIYVNRFDFVVIRRGGKLIRAQQAFSHPQLLMAAAYRLLGPREMEVFTDEMRFNDGTRVHVVMPPLAPEGPAISVRKPPAAHPSLDELVEDGALSGGMAEFLRRATEAGRSIVIAGPTGSGKSTLLSALTQQIAPGVRVIAIEQNPHLAMPLNAVRLEPNPGAGFEARYLVQAALSMHPQRIVLDECRGAEAYDWVTAAACGTEGSMATLHGVSATEALGRLESLCLMGSANVAPRGLREQIARAVNIVIVVNRNQDGGFRVQQITEVQGVDLDAFRINDVFYYRVEGATGGFHPTGYVPLFVEDMRHAGIDVDLGVFRE